MLRARVPLYAQLSLRNARIFFHHSKHIQEAECLSSQHIQEAECLPERAIFKKLNVSIHIQEAECKLISHIERIRNNRTNQQHHHHQAF